MLVHDTLRNTKLSTDYKVVDVDSKGLITGLNNEQEKELGKLNGFTFKEDAKKQAPKKQETKKQEPKVEENKEEPKEETKKTTPKKTTTRKTTTRKTTTKKEEK